jgi:hypothetical protein
MALTRRGCLGGLAGLGLVAVSALEPLGPALRRGLAAMASRSVRLGNEVSQEAGPALGREVAVRGVAPIGASPAGALLPAQLRAARRLLGWSEEETAKASGLSRAALRALEHAAVARERDGHAADAPDPHGPEAQTAGACAAERLRQAIEAAGVVFVGSAQEGPGVRFATGVSAGASGGMLRASCGQDDRK